jgi:hypothetical protein
VILVVTGPNGFRRTATTDVNGTYCVDGLVAGEYTVEIAGGVPAQYGFLTGQQQRVRVLGVQAEQATVMFRVTPLAFTGIQDMGRLIAAAGVLLLAGAMTMNAHRTQRRSPRHAQR